MSAPAVLLTARQLGSALYGQYASSLLLGTFLSLFFNLGLDLWLQREGGLKPHRIARSAGSVLAIKFLLGLGWLVMVFFLAPLIQSPTLVVKLVRLGAVNVWIYSLLTTALNSFKAVLQNKISASIEAGVSAARLLGVIALVAASIQQVTSYIYLQTVIYSAGLILALFLIRLRLGIEPQKQTIQKALKECPPYAASEFLNLFFTRMDALLVAFLLTAHDVSIYSLAEGILTLTFIAPIAVISVTIPALSRLFITDSDQAWSLSKRSLGLLFFSGFVLFLVIYLGAPVLVWFLDTSYQQIVPVLRTLSIIIWLHSITSGFDAILVARGRQRLRPIVQTVAVVFNLVANLYFAPRAGLIGVAGVFIASEIILLLGYAWLATHHPRSI